MASRRKSVSTSHLTSYTVSYDSSSHWSVITQRWGSIWPQVFPYCLLNVGLMVTIHLVNMYVFDVPRIKISKMGVTFVSTVVAFLLVSRVNNSLARFNTARDCLVVMFRESREFIQNLCVYSMDNTDQAAKEWRNEVAYRCLVLLRVCMAVIDYESEKVAVWKIPELNGVEKEDIMNNLFVLDPPEEENELSTSVRRWAHDNHCEWEDSLRVPVRLAYLLKKSIHSQGERLTQDPIPWANENRMLGCVDSFMSGFYGMRRQLTTPIPFPLVQMSRTFVFLYVFVVPFVLVEDNSSFFAHCFTVFIMTFGFIGLEICAINLDDPFGDDENDFDNIALAMTAYEDTYLTILDIDGPEYTDKLRKRMWDGKTVNPVFTSEQSWLLSTVA